MTDKKTLEAALAEIEASNAEAVAYQNSAAFKLEEAERNALEVRLAALPQAQRRKVLDAAGMKDVSAAPPPISPVRFSSYTPSKPVTQVQDSVTRIPMPITAEQKEVTAKAAPTGPRLQVNKAALIAQHKHEWPTIEGDIRGASENGLSKAAKAGARDWYEDAAIQWARSKNKLIQPTSAATLNSAMSNFPSRKHRLEG